MNEFKCVEIIFNALTFNVFFDMNWMVLDDFVWLRNRYFYLIRHLGYLQIVKSSKLRAPKNVQLVFLPSFRLCMERVCVQCMELGFSFQS